MFSSDTDTVESLVEQSVSNMSSPPIPSPTDHAPGSPLALEEILRLIFQFTEQARVVEVITLNIPASQALGPIELDLGCNTASHDFYKDLLSSLIYADWNRFREYAFRVRCVKIDYALEADLPLDSAALVQMFHRTAPLLPNIETISWRFIQNQNCTSITPLIGPRLEHLALFMETEIGEKEQQLLMRSIPNLAPNLRSLRLASFVTTSSMTRHLSWLISSLPKLRHLELPAFFLPGEVVAAAAGLPLLRKLDYSGWRNTSETYNQDGMCFEFTPASFPELETLSFASLPDRMFQVLRSTVHVSRLQAIRLDCPTFSSPKDIKKVFTQLAAVAQCLVDLQLVCSPVRQLDRRYYNTPSLSTETIRPLFSCTRLKRFHLVAPHFAPLTDGNIVEMGRSWPAMRSLSLSPAPSDGGAGTRYNMLSAFAKNLPDLQKLRLYFGGEIPEFDGELYPIHKFTKLETLGVGVSPVPRGKAQEIGFLLASLCQNGPTIEVGITKYHRGDDISEEHKSNLMAGWSEVNSAMNLAFRTKRSFARRMHRTEPDAEPREQAL
ncbi:hypothetical protein FRC00_001624 [Tulasnella sp. 408]|nr:hypothetical protein FRC00_001624 [Tulasnella sp. 408]